MTVMVIRTHDGISHGVAEHQTRGSGFCLDTACRLLFASWSYRGTKQGRRNRRKAVARTPELTTGDVDCMACLVRAARP